MASNLKLARRDYNDLVSALYAYRYKRFDEWVHDLRFHIDRMMEHAELLKEDTIRALFQLRESLDESGFPAAIRREMDRLYMSDKALPSRKFDSYFKSLREMVDTVEEDLKETFSFESWRDAQKNHLNSRT